MKSKKAISGVIATVLVLLITVVAAGILISFILPFVQKNLVSSTECLDYKDYLKFDSSVGYTCYDDAGLHGFSVRAMTLEAGVANEKELKYHSADYNKDWKISQAEYDRVSEFVAEGEYHVDTTTVDGYAPGPAAAGSLAQGNNAAIKGFEIVFTKEDNSKKVSVVPGVAISNEIGGVRLLDDSIPRISVPQDGELQTYVYNAGGERYDQLEIYPVLQSGKLCDKTDTTKIALCKGVDLTP